MKESALDPQVTTLPEELKASLLSRLDDGKLELPFLPDVVWEVMELSAADDVDALRLARLIQRDQSLAGHVLRVANSPAYMPRMPIVSLQQAISLLGMNQLCEIAFAVSLQSRIFDVPGYEHEVRALWAHALGAAVYAKEIAQVRHRPMEGIFFCGLLHDIGKPIILQVLADLKKELGYILESPIVTTIMEAYHPWVGGRLAKQWSLPPQVHESITCHHDYQIALAYPEVVRVTALADCLSYYTVLPDIFEEGDVRNHPVLEELHLSPRQVDALLARREAVLLAVRAMA
ncbi:MAG: HDOD domain-containing protein [Candidatus Tectomicrobia bacterium]|uniref:HDOD domain-containing protein n=1 Tax=Tectimicrobiota bacterium TaxID=2528274 RepID=A0A932CM12_UNCTE|nr:HDOD domain-containing protein [Candidatus Tectomicrobia bacterium]